jgi:uncharacterized coiled-coil DUF342 family protein
MPRKTTKKSDSRSSSGSKVEHKLIESSIALQNKTAELLLEMNKLVKKMDESNTRIDTMVHIFEEAAQHIKSGLDEPIAKKLESLLEQNKTIARGLILLERYVKEKTGTETFSSPKPLPKSRF